MNGNPVLKFITTLFHRFGWNLLNSFWEFNLVLHVLGILLTMALIFSGLDWEFFQLVGGRSYLQVAFMSGAMIGSLVPILGPLIVFIVGKVKKNNRLALAGLLIGQAAILTLIISSAYKAVTGRVPPEPFMDAGARNFSTQFQFGFMNAGIFNGWPSGHSMAAFAVAVALITFYPEKKWLKVICIVFAIFVGISMAVTSIHWVSDCVAGALIGTAIGLTVGKSFYALYLSRERNVDDLAGNP